MIEIEIDGKKIEAAEGATIIEAADQVGIYIPRFCYHKKLTIAANCRMCLVEVEKAPKPMPACATPVSAQMKIFTASNKAIDAQKAVMEYLLINHPLDCPICDQGGECELQDLSMGFGKPFSNYKEGKRSVYDENLGPLIETEMTRCIQCTRCVRFGEEVAGLRELGVMSRGEDENISTYVHHFLRSELSGNIIDLCPVGALTAKPSRYKVRGWELIEHAAISPHDCVGSNMFVHSRFQEYAPQRLVMRVVPHENEAINETWISDRDRFSYEGLYHQDRVYVPHMKQNEHWQETSWENALQAAAQQLQEIIRVHGADQIAALASSSATTEELYLLQKLMRALGSNHIDHRVRQLDFSDQNNQTYTLGMPIAEIETLSTILLVGSDVRLEQPLISNRINKAYQENAQILAVNPIDYAFTFGVADKIIHRDIIFPLAEIVKALADLTGSNVTHLAEITPSRVAIKIAETLKSGSKVGIFIGAHAINHPQAATVQTLVQQIAEFSGATISVLTEGANSVGAWLAGALPYTNAEGEKLAAEGLNAKALLTDKPRKAYLLLNLELENDCAYSAQALAAIQSADLVICLNTFATPALRAYADFILPITPFTETAGTFVNAEETWQSFEPVSVPTGQSRPAWQVLCVLAQFLKLDGFVYTTAFHVRNELKKRRKNSVQSMQASARPDPAMTAILSDSQLLRFAPWHMYRIDALVRRSKPLQEIIDVSTFAININEKTATALHLREGDWVNAIQDETRVCLPLVIDNRLPDNSVLIFSGLDETAGFGAAMSPVLLEKEKSE